MKIGFFETSSLGLSNQTESNDGDFLDEKTSWVAFFVLSNFIAFSLLTSHLFPLIGLSIVLWIATYQTASYDWDKVDKIAFDFLAFFSNTFKITLTI